MAMRGTFDAGPNACPFVALELDRDRRSERPDYRHRCYAEQVAAPRTIAHQERYCLSPNFSGCPIFQDWAVRAAARPVPLPPGYEGRRAAPSAAAAAAAAAGAPRDDSDGSARAPRSPTDEPWPDSMDAPPPAVAASEPPAAEEPAGAQQLAAFDGPPPAATPVREPVPAAPPPGSGVGFAALTSPAPSPDTDDVPFAGAGATPPTPADLPLQPDLMDEPGDAPVPAFLAGRSSRPRRSPPIEDEVMREDVVPSWEITDRYGAQQSREPRSGGAFSRILTIAAVVVILALGVATVILVPGLLGGSPERTPRPSVAAVTSPSASAGSSAVAVIPTPTPVETATPAESVEPAPDATPEPSLRHHRVKSGDTMARIARRYGVSQEEILAANPQITNPDHIQVGQVIVIPPPD